MQPEAKGDDTDPPTVAAWHGTILPKTDADVWLAAGFAEYERIVVLETALKKESGGKLSQTDRDKLAIAINTHRLRSGCSSASRRQDFTTTGRAQGDEQYWIAVGKGVLILRDLRKTVGAEKFGDLMDSFGRANAGKKVTIQDFADQVSKQTGKDLEQFVHGEALKSDGGAYVIQSFEDEREKTLIVYGTGDEDAGNHMTAESLQNAIRAHWSNQTVPIKTDRDVTDDDLRNHHLLLIGRPDTNRIVERFADAFPVTFGFRSFAVRGDTYAHAGSAVLAATANPLNPRYSAVVLAGLCAEATTRTPEFIYHKDADGADVMVLPNGGKLKSFVAPARELVKEFNK